jgi:hypothetical protein
MGLPCGGSVIFGWAKVQKGRGPPSCQVFLLEATSADRLPTGLLKGMLALAGRGLVLTQK